MQSSILVKLKLLIIVIALGFAFPDVLKIPPTGMPAADLHNLHAFQNCAAKDNPYLMSGVACGDKFARDMFYPPLLYFSFVWLRKVDFPFASLVWAAFIGAGSLVCARAWISNRARWRLGVVWAWLLLFVLLAQYPLAFAIERGNCDILPLAAWTLAFQLWVSGRQGWSGFAAGTALALKIYPAFACLVVGVGALGSLVHTPREWRTVAWFGFAGLAAPLLWTLTFLQQTKDYVGDELPRFAATYVGPSFFSHTLKTVEPSQPWVFYAISAVLIACWSLASVLSLRRDPALIFAGALAMSTYFANVSYDYNSITAYPLLTLLCTRALVSGGRVGLQNLALSVLGIVAILGGRAIYQAHQWYAARVLLQVVWLLCTALLAPRSSMGSDEWRVPGALRAAS
jgi:Glycosyltransferase family 87